MPSCGEETLSLHLRAHGLTGWVREYRWAAESLGAGKGLRARLTAAGLHDWRADFAHIERRILVEVEGFGRRGQCGRHQTRGGFTEDATKYNEAVIAGWRLLRFTTDQVRNGTAIRSIQRLLAGDQAPE